MRVPYVLFTAQAPLPSLGGGAVRPRPIMPARVYGPGGDTLIDGFSAEGQGLLHPQVYYTLNYIPAK